MNYTQLTKRESQIMTILWNHDQEMSANDIKLASDGLSIYTISQALQYLLSIGYVEVTGIGKNKNRLLDYIVLVFLNLTMFPHS